MSDKAQNKCAQRLEYYFRQNNKNGTFDILNDIIEYVTLVHLED